MFDLVFIQNGLGRGGGYRTLAEWANRSAKDGIAVAVVAPRPGPAAALLSPDVTLCTPRAARWQVQRVGRRVVRAQLGGAVEEAWTARIAKQLAPPGRVRVLAWAPWLAYGAMDVDLVYSQHWEPIAFKESTLAHQRAELAMRRPIPRIVNSTWLAEQLAANCVVRTVYPGVDHHVFRPDVAPGRPSTAFRLVALGREDDWKGLADLRAALDLSGWRDLELCLFGTNDVAVVARPFGTERRVGSITHEALADLYRSADVVVTPSWRESFPLPPLEAMACGVPVVTTRIGTEDYACDGANCLVVPQRSPDRIAHALSELRRSPSLATALAANGLQTAQLFSWSAGYSMFRAALRNLTTLG